MRRSENFENRVEELRLKIEDATARRDAIISNCFPDALDVRPRDDDTTATTAEENSKAAAPVPSPSQLALSAQVECLKKVHYRELPGLLSRSAQLAERAQGCVSLATQSSQRIRTLDVLLQRVTRTLAMTEAMARMEENVGYLAAADDAELRGAAGLGDAELERMVTAIHQYESSRRELERDSSTSAGKGARIPENTVVESKKMIIADALLELVNDAIERRDKAKVQRYTILMSQLGEQEAAGTLYSQFVGAETVSTIKQLVDGELRRMLSPTESTSSHLSLVSRSLDLVAAAFESEEELTAKYFGPRYGPPLLLKELHLQCTKECVPVLRDFMDQKRELLPSGLSRSAKGGGSGGPGASPSTVAELSLDTRRADLMLEEMGHLVACCHLYFSFVEKKYEQYQRPPPSSSSTATGQQQQQPGEGDDGGDERSGQPPPPPPQWALNSVDNPLMAAVQEILGLYIPLQQRYLTLAFDQAVALQEAAMAEAAEHQKASAQSGEESRGGIAAAAGMLYGQSNAAIISSIARYLTEEERDEGEDEFDAEDKTGFIYFSAPEEGKINLIDDVFFFLRIAIQRALNTQSTQIVSAVLLSITENLQERLVPYIEKRVYGVACVGGGSQSANGGIGGEVVEAAALKRLKRWRENKLLVPPPQVLRWCQAAAQTAAYMAKLVDEVRRCVRTAKCFTQKDTLRFQELSQDIVMTAQSFAQVIRKKWCEKYIASFVFTSAIQPYLQQLSKTRYHVSQEDDYQLDLYNSWSQTLVTECEQVFAFLRFHLDSPALRSLVSADLYAAGGSTSGGSGAHPGAGDAGAAPNELVFVDPFDIVLCALARSTCSSLKATLLRLNRSVSIFGAFRAEREVKQVQDLFLSQTSEVSSTLRSSFAPLVLLLSLWMCDQPSDALEETHNAALTPGEKKEALLCRTDFDTDEVMRLPL